MSGNKAACGSAKQPANTSGEALPAGAGAQENAPALPDLSGKIESGKDGAQRETGPDAVYLRYPDFKVSGCFSSHMVLQRGVPVPVYGFSRHPGLKVNGYWQGEYTETVVDADGRFRLEFAPRAADCTPSVLVVSSVYGSVVFEDVLVGDVWLIGGQSNGECGLGYCLGTVPEAPGLFNANDSFRLFRQSQAGAYELRDNCAEPAWDIIKPEWQWKRPDRNAAAEFSAMGYYFAKELTRHTDVPLGLIMLCPGGACLRELMPTEVAHAQGYTVGANMPVGGYYNTLISPLVGLAFKGQLFFQGESESLLDLARRYDTDLEVLIRDERARFGINFPFYNVQLCSYRDEGGSYFPYHHLVRVKQYDALRLIPDSHLAVCRDLGSMPKEADWAHSPYKRELGRRLAMQVYAHEYGGAAELDEGQYESPYPVSVKPVRGGFSVKFKAVGTGLRTAAEGETPEQRNLPPEARQPGVPSKVLKGFGVLLGDALEPVAVPAVFKGKDTVFVKTAGVDDGGQPVTAVTYALFHHAGVDNANLVNSHDLPAPAFCVKPE